MKRRVDRHQLALDWTAAARTTATEAAEAELVAPAPAPPKPSEASLIGNPNAPPPIQVLPWDFQTTFPPVLPDAVEAGFIDIDSSFPENAAVLHQQHAGQMLAALQQLDALHDARRHDIHPATGKAPLAAAKKKALPAKLALHRLQRWWQNLLDTYEAAFGPEAATAFGKFVHARHAGIEVATTRQFAPLPSPARACELPQPGAIRESVHAGVFGYDENGAVDPSEDEIFDITKNHAEAVSELMENFEAVSQSEDRETAEMNIQAAEKKYAEDFGENAAAQLVDYCHLQTVRNRAEPLRHHPDD